MPACHAIRFYPPLCTFVKQPDKHGRFKVPRHRTRHVHAESHREFGTAFGRPRWMKRARALPSPLWGRAGMGGRAERKSKKNRPARIAFLPPILSFPRKGPARGEGTQIPALRRKAARHISPFDPLREKQALLRDT
jgi:hypothetical protein